LRQGIDRYLGNVDFTGRRVLDVGAASGFLTFSVESRGADVVSYDLAPDDSWDIVPFAGADLTAYLGERRELTRKLNNAYWFCHRAIGSCARMVHGTLYAVRAASGPSILRYAGASCCIPAIRSPRSSKC